MTKMINAFLPSDFASEFELAQVGETEVHALQYGVEDVANHLLKQPFSVFLDKLSGDESVRQYIDTFLRFADRPTDRLAKIVYFEQDEAGVSRFLTKTLQSIIQSKLNVATHGERYFIAECSTFFED